MNKWKKVQLSPIIFYHSFPIKSREKAKVNCLTKIFMTSPRKKAARIGAPPKASILQVLSETKKLVSKRSACDRRMSGSEVRTACFLQSKKPPAITPLLNDCIKTIYNGNVVEFWLFTQFLDCRFFV